MASNPAVPFIADRTDIHKSCKSLESLINTLNDYCEAASAVVQLQKKLAKALREIASLKVTGEIPGVCVNALKFILSLLTYLQRQGMHSVVVLRCLKHFLTLIINSPSLLIRSTTL